MNLERFSGGSRLMMVSGVLGVIGLAATFAGMIFHPEIAYHAYLVAFLYWVGISVGATILLACFHATGARWMVVLRRANETMAVTTIVFVVLFIPVLVGKDHLFGQWLHPTAEEPSALAALKHKAAYLNMPFFLGRAVLYFGFWVVVSQLLWRWSTQQDTTGDLRLTLKQRRLGTGSLPFLGLTITFAAFDWIMSLSPLWGSTIFGAYFFAGGFLGAICILAIAVAQTTQPNLPGNLSTSHHLHNLGKLMLAFTVFWAYMAFSQFLLVWIANIPEENFWYINRIQGEWRPVALVLLFGQLIIPFFALLSRDLKLKRGSLTFMALWILVAHYVDMYWLVMPTYNAQSPTFDWTHVTAFIGVGGVAIAYAVFRARGRYMVPVKDPYLAESLRYVQ